MYLVIVVLVIAVILFAVTSIKIVEQSKVLIIERLGKFHKKAESGLNIIIPILDKIAGKIDLRTQIIDLPPQSVITRDNVTMNADAVVYFQVTDPFKATYEIADLVQAIRYLATTTLRDIIGTMDLDRTLSLREDVNRRLRLILDEATGKWGARVERVELENIDLSEDIKEAMEKQMRAEREKRAVILEAEGNKQSLITEAEGNKTSQILNAEAEKISAILKAEAKREAQIMEAEGEAEAIRKVAEAEAEKVKVVFSALKGAQVDEGIVSIKYIEALTVMANGENKVFMPFASSALMGTVGTLKNIMDKTSHDKK